MVTITLASCGGSEVKSGQTLLTCDVPMVPDVTGTSCVAPEPIQCAAPTVPDALNEKCVVGVDPNAPAPVYFPAEDEAVLYFNRVTAGADNSPSDPAYDGYKLHTWNNATCDAYAPPFDSSDWSNGHPFDGIDPNYGAYWIIKLKADHSDCGNFIIHIGTDDAGKALGPNDLQMPLAQDDPTYTRMNFTFDGEPSVFEYPLTSLGEKPLQIKDFAAHWLNANTFVWLVDEQQIVSVKLHHSAAADIQVAENDQVTGNIITLTPTTLDESLKTRAPLVSEWPAFFGDIDQTMAKALAKEQLVLVGYDEAGKAIAATYVQTAKALDALYTATDNDADEASLGIQYMDDVIKFSVWAPTAQQVKLKFYSADKNLVSSHLMTEDSQTGIWHYSAQSNVDQLYYRYELTLYHPQNQQIEVIETTDPYSVGLAQNGTFSQVVNLSDAATKPEGWDEQEVPSITHPEDAVIYEGHVRDFSAMDQSTPEQHRGKFLAFTDLDTNPVKHLKSLQQSGVTHFHLLPANDIASINEDPSLQVNLTDTVAALCQLNANAPVCGVESPDSTLQSVLESYSPFTDDAAKLVNAMRGFDSFNWGYDPKHFNVPDGIYATNPDGIARIKEMRAMVQSLHQIGLRVVLDVVYNHTNSAGLWDNSVFDKVVPGYYHSRDLITGAVLQSTCCNDTALEHRMMDKFMQDSLVLWAEQYKIDGFRFDIMSHGSKAQMLAAREAVRAIDEDTFFYGEGWGRPDRGFEHATQFAMAGSEIATFNDRLRDGVRSGQFFSQTTNENGPFIQQDIIKFGMAGTLADFVLKTFEGNATQGGAYNPAMYARDPADIINYVSKHDNETLWDKLQLSLPFDTSLSDRVRVQNMAQAIVLLSQGIPFLEMGDDFLRSKSLDGNSYDAGDWYNRVDFTLENNNWNVGLPLEKRGRTNDELVALAASPYTKPSMNDMVFASSVFQEFVKIRQSSPLFRLTTAQDIIDRVGFHNIGKRQTQGLIVMSIDDGTGLTDLDPAIDAIVVVVNGSAQTQSKTVATASGFTLHPLLLESVDETVKAASFTAGDNEGTFTVPPLTVAVFVKPQTEIQGDGLKATATAGAPDVVPYGNAMLLVRGDMNNWGETDAMNYIGSGVYRGKITLAPGSYYFKVATADWTTVNLGAPSDDAIVEEQELQSMLPFSNDNFVLNITTAATYLFYVDASDPNAPILTVKNEEPFVGTTVYVRGAMNGWGETNPLHYIGNGQYETSFSINAGSYEFKVASADWATVNMGAPADDKTVQLGEHQLLVSGSNDNLTMTFTETGEYTFIFDASNLAEPTLTVYAAAMFGNTPVYIRGSMNGWGEVDTLSYQGNSLYQVDINLAAGDYEFKVASADWSTVNLGANEQSDVVVLSQPYQLVQGSNSNLKLSLSTDGRYRFEVKGPNPNTAIITVSLLP
jgi:pullulanase